MNNLKLNPMETAPRDGTRVRLYNANGEYMSGYWSEADECWNTAFGDIWADLFVGWLPEDQAELATLRARVAELESELEYWRNENHEQD